MLPPTILKHPSSTPPLRCIMATIKCSHAQTPAGSRPLLACFVPSRTGPVPRTKQYNTAPVLAPEMRASTNEPDCQTFLRRWTLADPTTAAEPGIRVAERPKKSTGNLTPPNMIRAMAPARCPPPTPVTWVDIYEKIPGSGNLIHEAPNRLYETGLAAIRGGATRG
jgi:hypothetical protein